MANEEQMSILRQGVDVWNEWRRGDISRKIDLSGADLRNRQLSEINLVDADLSGADLTGASFTKAYLVSANLTKADMRFADFSNAILTGAVLISAYLSKADLRNSDLRSSDLSRSDMVGAYLAGAKLYRADLSDAVLYDSDFENADLSGANLYRVNLEKANLRHAGLLDANLSEANLQGANLIFANFLRANLSSANLLGANLNGATMVETKIDKAKISGSSVYGISTWDLVGEFEEQKDLVISRKADPIITVDNVEVAQFVYLLLNNQKIRNVIDTVTTKTVLILGRFYEERKQVLDALKETLRKRGFVPILFDFEPSKKRDLTETIQLLANMAKFVIADITDAKSIPQELSHIIPFLPSVPIQPILLISKEKEYAMFEHWRTFDTVLPEFLYLDKQDLLDNLEAKIIQPIDTWRKGQNEVSTLQNRIKELEAKISGSK
jgi:uncharacterized protein YjbI with pentapeptide repeats